MSDTIVVENGSDLFNITCFKPGNLKALKEMYTSRRSRPNKTSLTVCIIGRTFLEYVDFILDCGIDINVLDGDGYNILHTTALYYPQYVMTFARMYPSVDPTVVTLEGRCVSGYVAMHMTGAVYREVKEYESMWEDGTNVIQSLLCDVGITEVVRGEESVEEEGGDTIEEDDGETMEEEGGDTIEEDVGETMEEEGGETIEEEEGDVVAVEYDHVVYTNIVDRLIDGTANMHDSICAIKAESTDRWNRAITREKKDVVEEEHRKYMTEIMSAGFRMQYKDDDAAWLD